MRDCHVPGKDNLQTVHLQPYSKIKWSERGVMQMPEVI